MGSSNSRYDFSDFSYGYWEGSYTLMYGTKKASPTEKRWYQRHGGERKIVRKTETNPRYKNTFGKNFSFSGRAGHMKSWARPLSASKGGAVSLGHAKFSKGANMFARSTSARSEMTMADMARQLHMAAHLVVLQASNFKVASLHRAHEIFQKSFRQRRFYSLGASAWPALAPSTIKKRARRHTGQRILDEYGDLKKSLKVDENGFTLHTETIKATGTKQKGGAKRGRNAKKRGGDRRMPKYQPYDICYAGWHNEGAGTYGLYGGAYKKRQFMGHSTYLDPMVDRTMKQLMKTYLFDSVFVTTK